jgi:hypothetical protein
VGGTVVDVLATPAYANCGGSAGAGCPKVTDINGHVVSRGCGTSRCCSYLNGRPSACNCASGTLVQDNLWVLLRQGHPVLEHGVLDLHGGDQAVGRLHLRLRHHLLRLQDQRLEVQRPQPRQWLRPLHRLHQHLHAAWLLGHCLVGDGCAERRPWPPGRHARHDVGLRGQRVLRNRGRSPPASAPGDARLHHGRVHGRAARLYGVEPGRWAGGTPARGARRGAGLPALLVVVCPELLSCSIRAELRSGQQVPGPRVAGRRLFRRAAWSRAADGDVHAAGVGGCALFGGGRSRGRGSVRDRLRPGPLLPGDRRRLPRAACPGSSPRRALRRHRPQSKAAVGGVSSRRPSAS